MSAFIAACLQVWSVDPGDVVRSAISIVPQSPDLFEGTIRDNIDPLGASSDADIWVALEQVRRARVSGRGHEVT